MKVIRKKSDEHIVPEGINEAQGMAYCAKCQEVFSLATLAAGDG